MNQYQLMIIGGGPAGYGAAIRAAQLGLKTTLVEERQLGGTCLNRGCIPTKALLHATSAYAKCAQFEQLGLTASDLSYNMAKIHARKDQVIQTLRDGISQLMKINKVDVITGKATIKAPGSVTVDGNDHTTDKILIATGSKPSRPPIPGLDLEGVVTSDELLEGPVIDYHSLIIIGGGVIGVEMASIYLNLGCKVTIIEAMDRLIPTMDREISQNLTMILKKRGAQIFCSALVEEIIKTEYGLSCRVAVIDGPQSISAQGVLVSIGRLPNTSGLFTPEMKPEMEKNFIRVDERFETSFKGIFAVGDVIGGIQLAHKAEAEGLAAVEMICGHVPSTNPSLVPLCIYTDPEIATVGISYDDARLSDIDVKSAKYLMSANAKSIIDLQERGFIKVVFDAKTEELLGVQMMCAHATDLIGEFAGAILNKTTRAQLLAGMRPHPTFTEGISEALKKL